MQFFHEIVDLPEVERDRVGTAFREMLLNTIEHGGRFDPSLYVEISYARARHIVMCRVKIRAKDSLWRNFNMPQLQIPRMIQFAI